MGDISYIDAAGLLFCRYCRDLQVKIRGHRDELLEVEHHIKNVLPPCARVVVDAVMLHTGTQSLTAFLQVD